MGRPEIYNVEWDEGQFIGDIELKCWRHYHRIAAMGAELLPRHIHMKNAIQAFFPEKFSVQTVDGHGVYEQRGYIWNKWMERRNYSACCDDPDHTREFQTWWGASATGKSTDSGILALMKWLASPQDTTCIVMSTTKDALEQRIWREIVKFYNIRKSQLPGELVPSKTAIYYDKTGDTLSGIHGVAAGKGDLQKALGNIIGRHNTHVYVFLDEMQSMPEAAVEAWDNLSSGVEDCQFIGMGNPMSKLDPLGNKSMPVGGWDKLTDQVEEWRTPLGHTLYFDGLKSPGVDDPDRYPFLLTQRQIDKMRVDPGEDSPRFWTMRRGFLPPDGLVWAVLNDQLIGQYHVLDEPVWRDTPQVTCGIDPSFSTQGDKCIMYPSFTGETIEGKTVIAHMKPIQINLVARTVGKSMLDDLTDKICMNLKALNCPVKFTGMDTTGNQWMLADAVEAKMGEVGILRVSFAGTASKDPISLQDPKPASDLYSNRVTELWGRFGVYVKSDMIRSLAPSTCKQFSVRVLDFDKGNIRRVTIESKVVLRERLGFSPDEADAAVVNLEVVRVRLGIQPDVAAEAGGLSSAKDSVEILAIAENDAWFDDDGFGGDIEENIGFDDEMFL